MIAPASALAMRVGRFSKPQRGVGVTPMPDAGLNITQHIEVPSGAGVLRLLVSGVAVEVSIDCHCVADGVEVTH